MGADPALPPRLIRRLVTRNNRLFVLALAAVTALVSAGALLSTAAPLAAQGPDEGDGVRFGVSLGGISTFSLSVEFFRDSRSIDVSLGSWSFREASLSVVGKQYFGAGSAKPVVGAGLWMVAAASESDRTGFALVLRAPIGVDWEFSDPHALGFFLNVNRGLAVRRSNPADELPLNKRLVPLPELYYRYAR